MRAENESAASGGFPSRVQGVLKRLVWSGTEGYDVAVARRLRILNALALIAVVTSLVFAARYALIRPAGSLWPLSVWSLCNAALWLVTPLFNRYGAVTGVVYFTLVSTIGLSFLCVLAGPAAGVHYFLLAAPALVLIVGSDRPLLSVVLVVIPLIGFLLVEFGASQAAAIAPLPEQAAVANKPIAILATAAILSATIFYAVRLADRAEAALEREYERSELLLNNLMPVSIAERLKNEPEAIIADQFDAVTILFADIVDFTPRSARLPPQELVRFLNRVFSAFDVLAEKHGLEKIKTIGDAYMVAGGMPERRDGHAQAVADMALDMLSATRSIAAERAEDLAVRIGIHTGPAIAGVIGTRKLFYDVWGDTVNTASRMESQGSAGRIQVTPEAKTALGPGYVFEPRGVVEIKGKGPMELYHLLGRA